MGLNILGLILMSCSVFANEAPPEHGAPPPAAEHGAPAAEPPKTTQHPWQDTLNQVRALKAKRGQALANLTHARHALHGLAEGSAAQKKELAEYAKLYKEYRDVSQEYNQQLAILKYRYPDRLAKEQNRNYQTVEIESESELAEKLDLDQRLTNTVNKSRQQYADRSQEKQKSEAPSVKKVPLGPMTIREEEAILLSK